MGNEEIDLISIAKPEKKSLLERYDIPIGHLSYEFISQCTNEKILERIVLILRSGEEGVYPDLTKHAEERLARIKPTSAILRKAEPVLRRNMLDPKEQREIDNDISDWTCEMQSRERDLKEGKAILIDHPYPRPEIREIKANAITKNKREHKERSDKPKRISSCDYAAWDKYDVDTEINRIDLQDQQRQVEMTNVQEWRKERARMSIATSKATVDKSCLSGTELNVIAAQEREKGNEAFRATDYEEALRHYNASIAMDSSAMAYNNRAITFIKLQCYEDALDDCNMVLAMDYTNVKAILRRALSLEHLEKTHQALADYEAVLKLEPTNKTAISGVNKLRKRACESRKVRMTIREENMDDGEDKIGRIKSKRSVEITSVGCPKQHVNSDICYCDRVPSSSRNVATKPHIKASYCVESKSNVGTVNATANKSIGKTTKIPSSSDQLSPLTKDHVYGNENQLRKATKRDNPPIFRELFAKPRVTESTREKSVFSYASSLCKMSLPTSVIIEELPNDETYEQLSEIIETGKAKKEKEKKDSPFEKHTDRKSKVNEQLTLENIKIANEYREKGDKLEKEIQGYENIESPYEFLRVWQSLKDDVDLKLHGRLLRSVAHEDLNKLIGNKLDATMFSLILRCLEQQFCAPKDADLLANLLYSLSRLNRFSIIYMFMDFEDKKALGNTLRFLEKHGSSKVSQLRQIYDVS